MGKKTQKKTGSNTNEQSFVAMRLSEIFGLLCLFLSAYLFLSLFSHNPNDPSLNVASPSILVENSAGIWGAYISDYLIQSFGLSAFILPIVAGAYAFQ